MSRPIPTASCAVKQRKIQRPATITIHDGSNLDGEAQAIEQRARLLDPRKQSLSSTRPVGDPGWRDPVEGERRMDGPIRKLSFYFSLQHEQNLIAVLVSLGLAPG